MQLHSDHINKVLTDPVALAELDMVDLQFWAIQYPQVPLFRALLAKKARQNNYENWQQYRMEAAASVTDRKILYYYLESQTKSQPVVIAPPQPEEVKQAERDVPVAELSTAMPQPGEVEQIAAEPFSEESESAIEPAVQGQEIRQAEVEGVPVHEKEGMPETVTEQVPQTLPAPAEEEVMPVETASDEPAPAVQEKIAEQPEISAEPEPEIPAKEEVAVAEMPAEAAGVQVIELKSPLIDEGVHSFTEWLDLIEKKSREEWIEPPAVDYFPEARDEVEVMPEIKISNETLVQQPVAVAEIEEVPEPLGEEEKVVAQQAQLSLEFSENLMTETLASLYLKQGKKAKALKIYKALALNNPEKSSYFAALIKQIEES